MGDRDWVLSVVATEGYRQQHRPWLAWAVGVVGLLFATLLQVLMLGMTGRTAAIQRYRDNLAALVDERTRQLAERSSQAEAANRAKTETDPGGNAGL
ncbi:hypothetical protein [uncultured Thiodictyon sp.]|uniref:hypothetical protein n=1 Tax=uncultured Thiodictyon sp. TaxID=1846217 RepID=UPI0025FEC99F|nr:hypothetical protein [uncultured Thiodictyon sp.]